MWTISWSVPGLLMRVILNCSAAYVTGDFLVAKGPGRLSDRAVALPANNTAQPGEPL